MILIKRLIERLHMFGYSHGKASLREGSKGGARTNASNGLHIGTGQIYPVIKLKKFPN
jgi:hypothetical protein